MDERRRFVRLAMRLPVDCVVLPQAEGQRVMSKDVSGGGLRLFAPRALAPGTQLQLAIHVPGREPINAVGEVVWSETQQMSAKTDQQQSVEIGVRAAEIAPQDQEALMAHVRAGMMPPPQP